MNAHSDDTIVALSSPAGPGGRAVVRLSGPQAIAIATRTFSSPNAVCRDRRRRYEGVVSLPVPSRPLPADLYVMPGPHTFTGQDVAELHVLSCPPLIEQFVTQLLEAGARPA